MSKEVKLLNGLVFFEVPRDAGVNADTIAALEVQLQATDAAVKKADPVPFAVIQYECGNCCIEALGINFRAKRICKDRVVLSAPDIITKAYHDGRVIDKQLSHTKIIIMRNHFCILELCTTELDPCAPLNIGVSPMALELHCGACCIKALNVGTVTNVDAAGVSLLAPPAGQLLYVKSFNNGKLISVRSAKSAFVETSRICSHEQDVLEVGEPQWACGCKCEC